MQEAESSQIEWLAAGDLSVLPSLNLISASIYEL
jgi:hypothetical protein